MSKAHGRLKARLADVDLRRIGISPYNQRYLAEHLTTRDAATLRLYKRLLGLSLRNADRALGDTALVDFGGGHGLMTLLAKELGVGTVVYTDIYDVSCADVQILGKALGLAPDRVVCGDLGDLIRDVKSTGLKVDAMVSADVIEHIYDISAHLRQLPELRQGRFRAIYASTANIENPRYVRWISNIQRDAELKARAPTWGHKERDDLRAYRSIRAEMIRGFAPGMSSSDVAALAVATRGLIKSDIELAVREFEQNGSISYRIDHPTNTCDPTTGNWTEHLMDLDWLVRTAAQAGFAARVDPGLYELNGPAVKRFAQTAANVVIRVLGRRGMVFAPYYVFALDG
jgi:hypothetical protein